MAKFYENKCKYISPYYNITNKMQSASVYKERASTNKSEEVPHNSKQGMTFMAEISQFS